MNGNIIDCYFYFAWIPKNIIVSRCAAVECKFHDFKRYQKYLTEGDFVWLPSNFKRTSTIFNDLHLMNYDIDGKMQSIDL